MSRLYGFMGTLMLFGGTTRAVPTLKDQDLSVFERRQFGNPCNNLQSVTKIVGDGSPKDMTLWKQVTGKIECGDAKTCSIAAGKYKSWTIGADLGAASKWISGGLSVQQTWETGTTYTCEDGEGATICLWVKVPHVEYTVQNSLENTCGGFSSPDDETTRIRSPKGSETHRCSVSDCREEGDQYWE